ncbi:DUF2079 domain-containing protein [Nonomuraea roseoviolacea]|uniref:Membrane protein n=1 Tax=Nonomuraea roseoviolacea subsp. carminata TaxID=160689 RepID=A0ABT1K634_9ACTN|nr:DUF2079 domain-containing protein [Nonomuraea roseoviolacea]MCP2348891.1 putative membrane protein [Nonomuraea roseoviolacea subsp. carminata]
MTAQRAGERDGDGRRPPVWVRERGGVTGAGGGVRVGERRDRWVLAAITAVAALLYGAVSFVRFAGFRAGAYDLVIFDQAVRSYARLGLPVAVIKGVHNDFGPGFTVLGDHWSPVLAVLAPLYWIHDGPATLLVAQAVLLASAAVPLWVFTRRALGVRAAHLVAVAYALSWPVVETAAFDFHEAAFAPLLTGLLLERWQAGRRVHVVLAALALLCVKEDMGLLVAGFGAMLLGRRGWRALGAALAAGGLAATWLASQVLIPLFGGRADYYWAYGALGADAGAAARTALTDPLAVVAQLGSPPVKLLTLLLLLGVTLLAALGSPILLMAAPLLAERMLASSFPNWWVPEYHYNAFVVVVVLAAGVDGVRRLCDRLEARRAPWGARAARAWAVGVVAFAVASVPFFALADLADPASYRRDARESAAAAAVAAVPDGALVEAANNLAPALSGRATVLLWDRTPRRAPWVVAVVDRRTFPFPDVAEQRARVRTLLQQGYRVRFAEAGYVVLSSATGWPGRNARATRGPPYLDVEVVTCPSPWRMRSTVCPAAEVAAAVTAAMITASSGVARLRTLRMLRTRAHGSPARCMIRHSQYSPRPMHTRATSPPTIATTCTLSSPPMSGSTSVDR